jgi:dienelactone hydrolase
MWRSMGARRSRWARGEHRPSARVVLVAGLLAAAGCRDAPLQGFWEGAATYRGAALPVSVQVVQRGDTLHASISSDDLMILEQPLARLAFAPPRLRLVVPDQDAPLDFRLALHGDRLRGTAPPPAIPGLVDSNGGSDLIHLDLRRTADAAPAAPYRRRPARFGGDAAQLAGTLFVPAGARPHPAVVLLHGSSTPLRYEYHYFADRFARAGVAALVYDRRGTGASSGDARLASYEDLAADAREALAWLASQPEVDAARVGLWGLSQGAFLAPRVAALAPQVAFLVGVSPPGLPVVECAAYQDSLRLEGRGFSAADGHAAARVHRELGRWIDTGQDSAVVAALLQATAATAWRRHTALPASLPAPDERRGWYWGGRTLDPLPWWREVRVPVLLVFGEQDQRVPAARSAAAIETALRQAGNPDVVVRTFPRASHVLKTTRPPSPAQGRRWDWPRQAPGYLDACVTWVQERVELAGR